MTRELRVRVLVATVVVAVVDLLALVRLAQNGLLEVGFVLLDAGEVPERRAGELGDLRGGLAM